MVGTQPLATSLLCQLERGGSLDCALANAGFLMPPLSGGTLKCPTLTSFSDPRAKDLPLMRFLQATLPVDA
eukprot:CAMPEP_0178450396 /NCGR_PEP_ID=MMETSP0689_2-20121128/43101_1 /TAXON_ID=160604 /ORGANISM="Amphidinium massartii, Strain CS-259" /LENGTH=70 /DNA_ID=CAMNT_0020075857 /DNA_START=44 /DNA_END=256 /DNA_ORIENTATION=-